MESLTARALVALGLALAPLSLPTMTAPAQAHDGGKSRCVTQHEWHHAKRGMRKARVHRIFDSRGRFYDGGAGGFTREYQPCNWGGGTDVRLFVTYNGSTGRVAEKRLV
jgi:hypothetical protein